MWYSPKCTIQTVQPYSKYIFRETKYRDTVYSLVGWAGFGSNLYVLAVPSQSNLTRLEPFQPLVCPITF